MNLIGVEVNHKVFGAGVIANVDEVNGRMDVQFKDGTKIFAFPQCFKQFISVSDETLKAELSALIAEDDRKKQEQATIEAAEKAKKLELAKENEVIQAAKKPRTHFYPRKNIAFKCTYCDGGKSDSCIGFDGLCSDKQRHYNVFVGKRIWCSAEENLCRMCLDGKMSKEDLEEKYRENNAAVCYESNLFRSWSYEAGGVVNGINKGRPNTIRNVQTNSLCVLTTRKPNTDKTERYIFAVFIVIRSEEGDDLTAGKVIAHPKYRIALTEQESRQMCFWNYYQNKSDKAPYQWGSGLFRYINDATATDILRDIVKVKQNTADAPLAEEMLAYFTSING